MLISTISKKNGYKNYHKFGIVNTLRTARALDDPESVKEKIAEQKWVPKRKINAIDAYNHYCDLFGLEWIPPKYKAVEKIPYVPPEKYLDILIADIGPKTSVWIQCLKETGMRRGELHQVTWKLIDFVQGTIRCIPEKGSRPRIFKVSKNLSTA